jgi:hypothetical protein
VKTFSPLPAPDHYDPRCRPWYELQYGKTYSTFTDVYLFAAGKPGITNCVPLWSSDDRSTYYGTYCLDQFPTADDSKFVRKYYTTEDGNIVSYLIFNSDDIKFNGSSLYNTQLFNWTRDLVFTNSLNETTGTRSNYTINDMTIEAKRVDKLNEYMDQFDDQYNLDKIARLPNKTI